MTTAQKGLGKALARLGASGAVLAIAEMSTDDLLANLSDDQRNSLAASLAPVIAPVAGASDDGDPDEKKEMCSDCKEPMKEGKCSKCGPKADASAAAQPLSTNASINERVKAVAAAVAADGPCKGKADLALSILADDTFVSLSADAVIKMIGMAAGFASAADPEAAQRAQMQEVLARNSNSSIDAGSGGAGAQAATDHGDGWKKAAAKANALYGR